MSEVIGGVLCLLAGLFFAMGFGLESAKETGVTWPFFVSLFFTVMGAGLLIWRGK